MFELIGREFSRQSIFVKEYLEKNNIDYTFIDIDFDDSYLEWLKLNKIMGLPVLKSGNVFCVGKNIKAIDKIINLSKKS